MVRFSCFNAHVHSDRPKKTIESSSETFHKTLSDCSHSRLPEVLPNKPSSLLLNSHADSSVTSDIKHVSSSERGWKSKDMKNEFTVEGEVLIPKHGHLKKSQSMQSGLYREGMVSTNSLIENETDLGFSCDGSPEAIGLALGYGSEDQDQEQSLPDQHQKAPNLESFQVSCNVADDNESIYSIGGPPDSEKEGQENSDTQLSGECAGEGSDQALRTPHRIAKSFSLPNLSVCSPVSARCTHLGVRSKSFEDLHGLDMRWRDISIHDAEKHSVQRKVGDTNHNTESPSENYVDDNYDSCNYSGIAKDWIMPVMNKVDSAKSISGGSSLHQWDELPNRDFKIKRIEDWVNDLQHCSPLEETNELLQSDDHMKGDSSNFDGLVKVEDKLTPGMEVAKRYISSLTAATTTAHLANHGLVVIPFLSAFISLRVLNLSGNSIVRITAGALPRGLHMLNLSKNNISTIEGLRELTRLRVLDLSYNRIFRIGHGLASCSSLKELYLAGNRISEVEGLHRLLKLTVLDLRFNKISTAKCLGQLAANYSSLQAISLEGNPAQKNVGDDQLKKHLQGLLPHLAYFNRQTIKANTLKDSAERSVRLGTSSHQFDRGLRPDHKTRKGSVLTAQRPPSSSALVRGSQAAAVSPKRSKGRHSRLPPMGTKVTTNRHNYIDIGSKLMNVKSDLSMRRSRSEGTLGNL
ncbi:uncharacterized protein LOC115699760 [Cannabis sativa]|uniref:Uncharacterized protein n=1 Tax=Cannabis sativa TaxID=3483 RepID=A0A7J6HIW0_CANSA|nr:uncharacterized protein LOC115699760 [Cannabis sativa]XP_030483163.2 uncharacterized protein LOC115699760 [Cannabis sativa]KAF4394380.1 hypothetical protein G4B88_018530 [Cannabis sativa]